MNKLKSLQEKNKENKEKKEKKVNTKSNNQSENLNKKNDEKEKKSPNLDKENTLKKNKENNSDSTNNSSLKEKEEKEVFDSEKDNERRLSIIIELEKKRELKEKEEKKEKERIRKALLKVTSIVKNKNGLINLGNTCYMNSCLQILIHCSPFIEKLFCEVPTENLSKEFYDLCNEQLLNVSKPINIKNIFSEKHNNYKGFLQHDSIEFCRLFLEDISYEMNKVKIIPPYIELDDNNKTKEQINIEFDKIFKRRENSIVVDTFYGQFINIFKCKCGFETYSYEKFLDIPLLFIEKGTTKIKTLLKNFFEEEKIDLSSKCKKCKKKEQYKKFLRIAYLPEILILSLQRYDYRKDVKNNSKIKFKDTIDLEDFIDKDCCGNYSTKYNLIGIVNHTGNINFGHYYSFINIENEWFEFNDSSCFSFSKLNNSSETDYILIYERI